jgi:hypothetical protein
MNAEKLAAKVAIYIEKVNKSTKLGSDGGSADSARGMPFAGA